MDGEPRSKRLAKNAKLLMAAGFGLLMASVMLLSVFLVTLKPVVGESVALIFFSALLFAFSLLYFMGYIRAQCLAVKGQLREYIDAEMCQKPATSGAQLKEELRRKKRLSAD